MRTKMAVKNSVVALICQMITILFSFVTRTLFIKYIGTDILGASSTFTSILSTLSLVEMGFESAVTFALYVPIQNSDDELIEKIVTVLRKVYKIVGFIILILGLVLLPFLKYIITGMDLSLELYFMYIVMLIGTVVTYFFAYKQTLLFAMQKGYVKNLVTTIVKIFVFIAQTACIIITQNPVLYALANTLGILVICVVIEIYFNNNYRYSFTKTDSEIFKKVVGYVKDIFISKLGGYVYSSTDNLLISAFIGTRQVGLLSNYTMVIYQLRTLVSSSFSAIQASIGNFLADEKDKRYSFGILMNYTFVRYVIFNLIFVPSMVLMECFISMWIGDDYILNKVVLFLLIMDTYCAVLQGPLGEFMTGLGYFSEDRNMSLVAAIMNLVLSFIFLNNIGVAGVLLGTVITQIYYWISRFCTVYKKYFDKETCYLREYLRKICTYIVVTFALVMICATVFSAFSVKVLFIKFCIGGVVSIAIVVLSLIVVFRRTQEFVYMVDLIKKCATRHGGT